MSLVQQLPPPWSHHEENTARLYEAMHHWLNTDWAQKTTDPEDPEVRRDRAEAKRSGIRPPKHPLIPPIGLRPADVAESHWSQYKTAVEKHTAPAVERSRESLAPDEWARRLGIEIEHV